MAENFKAAGRIVGNPLCGLCERMCIEVQQVYDACIRRENNLNTTLLFTDYTAGEPVAIERIVSVEPVTVSDITVSAGNTCSQIGVTVDVPLVMTYRNAAGELGSAQSVLRYRRNVSLRIPRDIAVPFNIRVVSVVASEIATYSPSGVSFTYCIMDIVKVIITADILVPTYGYAVYPECTSCGGLCPGITEGSIYPETGTTT